MRPPKFATKEVADTATSLNFSKLNDFLSKFPLARMSGEFREINLPAGESVIQHNLGYQPKDTIVIHNSTNAVVTFDYGKFNDKIIVITSSQATTVRFIVGRYE